MGLKRTLNLLDATSVGIGAIIGAGIFVVLGIAIGYAGPGIIISIIIAGIVASFTAFSFAELGSAIPKEGGAYEYAFELISPFAGFLVGFLWLFAQIVAGARAPEIWQKKGIVVYSINALSESQVPADQPTLITAYCTEKNSFRTFVVSIFPSTRSPVQFRAYYCDELTNATESRC